MEQGYGAGSGRINNENEGGYGSELFDSTIGGYASGSESGGGGKKHFQNWISLCFNFFCALRLSRKYFIEYLLNHFSRRVYG